MRYWAKLLLSFLLASVIVLATNVQIFPQPHSLVTGSTFIPTKELSFFYDESVPEELKLLSTSPQGSVKVSVSIGKVKEIDNLGLEAYFIDIKDKNGRIIAASERGLFYAYQSINQLITSNSEIPAITIVDAPAFAYRGVIEGFYDTPWSHTARKDIIQFLGTWKMNTYVYAPKDDPYHREKWREPYPQKKLTELAELVTTAENSHVDFVFAISPGNTVQFTSERDWQALINKTEVMIGIGVEHFALLLDDIDPNLKSASDRAKYGNNYAKAQVDFCNKYSSYLKTRLANHRLIVVPTEYYQKGTSPYRETYANQLDPDIIVYSTGYGIVAETITSTEAKEIGDIWQHDILYWDNYPVNDYNRTRLYMAPIASRDAELPATVGFTFNPMNEAELSKLPLMTCADYTWNAKVYDPELSWQKAVGILGNENRELYQRFAEQNTVFFRHGPTHEYPTIVNLSTEFFKHFSELYELAATKEVSSPQYQTALKALKKAAEPLEKEFVGLEELRSDFPKFFPNASKEAEPYLKRMANLGKIGSLYVNAATLVAEAGPLDSQNPPKSLAKYNEALEIYLRANLLTSLDSFQTAQLGSLSVLSPLFDRLSVAISSFFGLSSYTVITNMPVYKNYVPSLAADNNPETFFWSARGQRPDDYLTVDLGRVEILQGFNLIMSNNNLDYFRKGKVEISQDGNSWEEVLTLKGKKDYNVPFEEPKEARYLRLRGEADYEYWIIIRMLEPILAKKAITITSNANTQDLLNRFANESFFVIEEDLTFTLESPTKIHLAALMQEPTNYGEWGLAYSLDGVNFSEPIFSDSMVQVLPLPNTPIKAIRFIPKEAGVSLRGIVIVPE